MNLKMNRSKSLGNHAKNTLVATSTTTTTTTNNNNHNPAMRRIRLPPVKIKQEVPLSNEERWQNINIDDNKTFKIEIEDEGDESLELSMSGASENSCSPSPSPTLTTPSQIPTATQQTSGLKAKGKPAQTIVINKLLQNPGAAKVGGALPGIFLIDSRPYQLIPNQPNLSNNFSAKELLQIKILSTLQQQQQNQQAKTSSNLASLPSLILSPSQPSASPTNESDSSTKRNESQKIATPVEQETCDIADTQGESVEEYTCDPLTLGSEPEYESDSVQNKDQDSQDNASRSSQEEGNVNSSDSDALIPNLFNELGMYDFKILLDAKEDTLKTPTWLVSKITNKLYTNMNKPIPFRVILNKNYPKKRFSLRAMAVFKYPMSQRQNVVRCPNHLNPSDSTNLDFTHTNHVIRADHPRASYESTPSGRLSVVVPLDFPEGRNEAIPILLKFMCHNSCVGGIHRRPMVVLLTLELNDEEVGRFAIDVRVCACPSRDVKTEEKHHIARGLFKNAGHVFENRRNRKRPRNDEASGNEDEEEVFYLPVRGSTLYNYLRDAKLAYLKHHPDYARKYPDPPEYLDPHSRFAGTSQQDETNQELAESVDPTEDIVSIESPQSDPLEIPIENERSQRFFLLCSNSGSRETPKIVKESDLPPEIRKRLENIPTKGNDGNVTLLANKAMIKKEKFDSECSDKQHTEADKSVLISAEAENNQPKKKNKLVIERSKSDGFTSHLQVVSMPSKEKSDLKVIPNKKKPNRRERNSQGESAEESEKVMLAARVLASHLGSQQLEK